MNGNLWTGYGRLTRDPEMKYSQGAEPIAITTFSLALQRPYNKNNDHPQADFVNFTAFRQTAEFISKYFTKGMRMAVTGRIQVDNYEDKEGNKRQSFKIVVEEAGFLDTKAANEAASAKSGGNGGDTSNTAAGTNTNQARQATDKPPENDHYTDDDDLPF